MLCDKSAQKTPRGLQNDARGTKFCSFVAIHSKNPVISDWVCELIAGIEPANLILTKDALYLLSYISMLSIGQRIYINTVLRKKQEGKSTFFKNLSHFFAPAAFQVCRGVFVSDDARQMAFVRQ